MPTETDIANAFIAACVAEIEAPKPGNVHRFADGHGMSVKDFLTSADAAAASLSRRNTRVGERIFDAVTATKVAVNCNTNLGIILLAAPLAAGAELDEPLRAGLATVLTGLDIDDANAAFEAISIAAPAGLGTVEEQDVRGPATCSLSEAMMLASSRDRIARAYTDDFDEIFGLGLTALDEAVERNISEWWPATAVYLAHLSAAPDSHIHRKHGLERAQAVRLEAKERQDDLLALADPEVILERLLDFDRALKASGLNPGTCADLTVATLFADRLQSILKKNAGSG
nr:triphosphoribosyl-dephospho-CoA synthase [Rhodoligotrophos appendicifer]